MGRKKKWKECVKPRTTTINGRAVKVPSLLHPAKVEEVVDANGKKVVHVTMKDRYAELHDFLKEVEDWWAENDFINDKFSLIERLKAIVQSKK